MTRADWIYLAVIGGTIVASELVFASMIRPRLAADPPKAYRRSWWMFLSYAWILTAYGVLLWVTEERAWSTIAVRAPTGWQLWASVGVVAVFVLERTRATLKVAKTFEARQKVKEQLRQWGPLAALFPRVKSDLSLWAAASVTAGISEEFIFRGYIIWAFSQWVTWWVAAGVSLVIFSLGHTYQGARGVLAAALGGACMTFIVAACGSLLPAMAVHALIDLSAGYLAWLAFRQDAVDRQAVQFGQAS